MNGALDDLTLFMVGAFDDLMIGALDDLATTIASSAFSIESKRSLLNWLYASCAEAVATAAAKRISRAKALIIL